MHLPGMNNRRYFFIGSVRMLSPVSLCPQQKRELKQIQSHSHTGALVRTIGVAHRKILPRH